MLFWKILFDAKTPKIKRTIDFHPCDKTEILEIIQEFDDNKASDINVSVLKCSLILVNFFNDFIDNRIFPNFFKCGQIPQISPILKIPQINQILKKGDLQYFDNYRPVSTLPIFVKVSEKIIFNRLRIFLSSIIIHSCYKLLC